MQVALDTGALEETSFAGEELNHLYGYVGQNPLYWIDPYGLAKGGKQNIRDSSMSGLTDEEVSNRARDQSLSKEDRRKAQKEEKARKNRNKNKRGRKGNLGVIRGFGPTTAAKMACVIMGPSPFNPFCPAPDGCI